MRTLAVLVILALAGGKVAADHSKLSTKECFREGGKCTPKSDCESSAAKLTPCEEPGAVCCRAAAVGSLSRDGLLGFDTLSIEPRVDRCSNRKCRRWYRGWWTRTPENCQPKRRLVMSCPSSSKWCCAPPCSEKPSCRIKKGYCVTEESQCRGRIHHKGCRGKMCFCCIPDGTSPPCSCTEQSMCTFKKFLSVCSPLGSVTVPADGCLSVHSPRYPFAYFDGLSCALSVSTDSRCQLVVDFCDVALEKCMFDTLRIDGGNASGVACGHTDPAPVASLDSSLNFTFSTDNKQRSRGFRLAVTSVCSPSTTTSTSTTVTSTTTATPAETCEMCQCTYTEAAAGEIVSPNYPNPYDNYHDCQMRIVVPEGYIIKFTYLLFELEYENTCSYDSFQIYDTIFADGPRFCDTTAPNFTVSSTNDVTIVFQTDTNIVANGFRLTFESVAI
ncbi:blastula protease 10-like [Penaeus chinensis]|uniref:blastula protease 10-like n=1 Tax=Penaeus chinensis TaxID=139456 RepID=UPI001FB6CA3F|nr:blastula protease 10-like [Penaeus chinensis]